VVSGAVAKACCFLVPNLDPFNGSLYVFRSKRADRVRLVWWDGSGVCLYSKALENHSFCWPAVSSARMRLDRSQLMALLAGLDWKKIWPAIVDGLNSACGKMNHPAALIGKPAVFMLYSLPWICTPPTCQTTSTR